MNLYNLYAFGDLEIDPFLKVDCVNKYNKALNIYYTMFPTTVFHFYLICNPELKRC